MIKQCPKCKQKSLIEVPEGRYYRTSIFADIYLYSVYQYKCHNEKCDYVGKRI
jgi:hypothetical protein